MRNNILILLTFFAAFWVVFLLLQNSTIYNSTLGRFADNWVNHEGKRQRVNQPFQQVNNTNYLQWDGVHYNLIKEHGYDIKKAGGDYIFAFFPFFPYGQLCPFPFLTSVLLPFSLCFDQLHLIHLHLHPSALL